VACCSWVGFSPAAIYSGDARVNFQFGYAGGQVATLRWRVVSFGNLAPYPRGLTALTKYCTSALCCTPSF